MRVGHKAADQHSGLCACCALSAFWWCSAPCLLGAAVVMHRAWDGQPFCVSVLLPIQFCHNPGAGSSTFIHRFSWLTYTKLWGFFSSVSSKNYLPKTKLQGENTAQMPHVCFTLTAWVDSNTASFLSLKEVRKEGHQKIKGDHNNSKLPQLLLISENSSEMSLQPQCFLNLHHDLGSNDLVCKINK